MESNQNENAWTDVDRAMFQLVPADHSVFQNLEVHRGMMSDRMSVESFRAALHQLVKPNTTVIDLGAGLGVLSFFSLEAVQISICNRAQSHP